MVTIVAPAPEVLNHSNATRVIKGIQKPLASFFFFYSNLAILENQIHIGAIPLVHQ